MERIIEIEEDLKRILTESLFVRKKSDRVARAIIGILCGEDGICTSSCEECTIDFSDLRFDLTDRSWRFLGTKEKSNVLRILSKSCELCEIDFKSVNSHRFNDYFNRCDDCGVSLLRYQMEKGVLSEISDPD
ncbi:MAG: hypothetical protein ACE5K4_08405 [Candidatus Hydrothermarchaeota archaeon]